MFATTFKEDNFEGNLYFTTQIRNNIQQLHRNKSMLFSTNIPTVVCLEPLSKIPFERDDKNHNKQLHITRDSNRESWNEIKCFSLLMRWAQTKRHLSNKQIKYVCNELRAWSHKCVKLEFHWRIFFVVGNFQEHLYFTKFQAVRSSTLFIVRWISYCDASYV